MDMETIASLKTASTHEDAEEQLSLSTSKARERLSGKFRSILDRCEAQLAEAHQHALKDIQSEVSLFLLGSRSHLVVQQGSLTPSASPKAGSGSPATRSRTPGVSRQHSAAASSETTLSVKTHNESEMSNCTLQEWKLKALASKLPEEQSRVQYMWSGNFIRHRGTGTQTCLGRVASSSYFDWVFSALIVLNCCFLGIQAHANAAWDDWDQIHKVPIMVVEYVFTSLFLVEVVWKIHVYGLHSFWPTGTDSRYNFVDLILALVPGLLLTWVLPGVARVLGFDSSQSGRTLTVLRVARLARLARMFYRVPLLKDAWLLIRGLSDSALTLLWTVVVITLVTYIFAIFGLTVITAPLKQKYQVATDPTTLADLGDLLDMLDGLDKFMFTLIQVLTVDSVAALIRSVMLYLDFAWVFFFSYMCIATLALMNLVTAIIVNNAVTKSSEDRDNIAREVKHEKIKQLQQMQELWAGLDQDGNGTVSMQEFRAACQNEDIAKTMIAMGIKLEDTKDLFHLLDDGDGEIAPEEFFKGCKKLIQGHASAKDVFKLDRDISELKILLKRQARSLRKLDDSSATPTIEPLEPRVWQPWKDTRILTTRC